MPFEEFFTYHGQVFMSTGLFKDFFGLSGTHGVMIRIMTLSFQDIGGMLCVQKYGLNINSIRLY